VLGSVDADGVVDRQHREQDECRQDAEADAEKRRSAGAHQDAGGVDHVPLRVDPERDPDRDRERPRQQVHRRPRHVDDDRRRDEQTDDEQGDVRGGTDEQQADEDTEIEVQRHEHQPRHRENRDEVDDAVGGVLRVLDGLVAGSVERCDEGQRADLDEQEDADDAGARDVCPGPLVHVSSSLRSGLRVTTTRETSDAAPGVRLSLRPRVQDGTDQAREVTVLLGRDGEVRSIDRAEDVDHAPDALEGLVDDVGADLGVIDARTAGDRHAAGDADDLADAPHSLSAPR